MTSTLGRSLGIAILVATTPFAFGNLITNGDFETGNFNGWSVTHAVSTEIFVGPGAGPDTTKGAHFAAVGPGLDAISQTFATTPGSFYSVSFFYQVFNSSGAPINEFDVLWNGARVGSPFPNINANSAAATFTFLEKANGTSTTLQFEGFNYPAVDFLDNVSVTPFSGTPAATPDSGSTLTLLLVALSALLGLAHVPPFRSA